MKVLCIGAAVIDVLARPIGKQDEWKEKQRISEIAIRAGGDAVNESIFLAALGMDPGVNICIGKDTNGGMLRGVLQQSGVDISCVREKEDYPTGTAIVLVDDRGERHIFSVDGAHASICRDDLPARLPEGLKAVSLASLFGMDRLEENGLEEFLKNARNRGILTFADMLSDKHARGLNGIRHLIPQLDYFLPSDYEAMALTGSKTIPECAKMLRELGAGTVVIKCGADGVYVCSPDFRGQIPAVPVKPLDTTGAGDCFAAVFIACILKGMAVEQSCVTACAAASYSTQFAGASTAPLNWEIIEKLMDGQ